MKRTILLSVVVLVCLGLCLGGLLAKPKKSTVQISTGQDELVAGLSTRDNGHVLAKAETLVGQARILIAAGENAAAIELLRQASLLELPATPEARKVLADSNLALGDLYSLEPAEGLHKSIHFYGIALQHMDISEHPDLMVNTLNTVAGIQASLGNDVEATLAKEAANNVAFGIVPEPLNQLPLGGADDPGDDDCSASVSVTLDHTEVMTVSTAGDHNWRDFSLSGPTLVRIETLSADTFGDDTDLNLYGGCSGTEPTDFIEFDDDDGPGFLSLIEVCLPPGDYWTEVGGYADIRTPDDFDLNITAVAPCVVPEPDEYEPDNTFADATKIGFRNNGVGQGNQYGRDNSQIQTHSFFPTPDGDFMKFSLSRANLVRIETMGDGDTVVQLGTPDGFLLAQDDDGGEGLSSKLEVCMPAEDDWLVLAFPYSSTADFTYDIAVDVEHPCVFEDEPNDSCDLAGELNAGELMSGLQLFDGDSDDDWFVFTLDEDSLISIETDGYNSFAVDTYLELWSGCPGALLDSDDDGGPGYLSLIGGVYPAGTYYVNVTASSFAFGAQYPYSVTLTVSEPPIPEVEPNDACATANAAALGDTYLASISPVGDRDNFALNVPADGYVEIETNGPFGDTVLQIQSADGSVIIACDDDSGSGLFSLFGCCLPAGDYCVTVRDFGDNSTISSYDINFRDLGACVPSGTCPSAGLGCPF